MAFANWTWPPKLPWPVLDVVAAPFLYLLDPSRRVFLPFLLLALFLAWVHAAFEPRFKSSLFSKELWLHPSARLDYRLFFAGGILRALILPSSTVSVAAIAAIISVGLRQTHLPTEGLIAVQDSSPLLVAILFTGTLFLLDDSSRFWLHRWLHKSSTLWQFHQIHHSAEVLTPFTVYRVHPFESLLFFLRGIVMAGLCTGFFFFIFGEKLNALQVFGVNLLGFGFNVIGANLRHSPARISYGKLEHLFISPAQHQLHHSISSDHQNTNFGSFLAIWDLLAGTLRVALPETRVLGQAPSQPIFGLEPTEKNHQDTVLSVWLSPLRNFRRALK